MTLNQTKATLPGRRHSEHWYFLSTRACPVCGGGETYRERRYGPKPSDPAKRYEYAEIYDWCNER